MRVTIPKVDCRLENFILLFWSVEIEKNFIHFEFFLNSTPE